MSKFLFTLITKNEKEKKNQNTLLGKKKNHD